MKVQNLLLKLLPALLLCALPGVAMAVEGSTDRLDLTNHWVGFLSIGIFILAYVFVMAEEFTKIMDNLHTKIDSHLNRTNSNSE